MTAPDAGAAAEPTAPETGVQGLRPWLIPALALVVVERFVDIPGQQFRFRTVARVFFQVIHLVTPEVVVPSAEVTSRSLNLRLA